MTYMRRSQCVSGCIMSLSVIRPNVTPPSVNLATNLDDITFSTQMPPVPCSVQSYTLGHPVVLEIRQQVSDLQKTEKSDVVSSVPGLTGVPGNEAAKKSTLLGNAASNRSLVMLAPFFIALFCRGKKTGHSGSRSCRRGALPTAASGLRRLSSHSFGLVTLTRHQSVTTVTPPHPTVLLILKECPRYDDERQIFHLFGALRCILGDDGSKLCNVVVLLRGIRFDSLI
jgi:hypothetical protein